MTIDMLQYSYEHDDEALQPVWGAGSEGDCRWSELAYGLGGYGVEGFIGFRVSGSRIWGLI